MKISIDDKELFTLTETQKKVIQHDIHANSFEEDMKRRIHYIVMHKYEQCFERLKREWDLKLRENGVKSVPTDPDEYARLVFEQQNYQDRKARDEK